MKKFVTVLILCGCLCLTAGQASALSLLGGAASYNLFVFGDSYVQNSDAEGSVAIGGNAQIANYSVASQRSGSDANLVVAGNLTWTNGQVGTGGSGTISAGSASLTGTNPSSYQVFSSLLTDFSGTESYLESTSLSLSGLSATGTTGVSYGSITLTGSNSDINVFDLSGADLSSANGLTINAPTGSTVLVNIDGSDVDITNMGFTLNNVGNSTVLYNLFQATDLDISGVGVQGSILAPFAQVDFSNGQLNGQLIASSLGSQGTPSAGEFHDVRFDGNTPSPVPEPATLLMLGLGLSGFAGLRLKRER